MTNKFVAFDVETANPSRSSVCSIGLVKFIDGQEVDSFYTLINPEEEFSNRNTRIHGIKAEDVQETEPSNLEKLLRLILGNTKKHR